MYTSFIIFWCLFIFEKENTSWGWGTAEREGSTESEAGSRLWAISTEPKGGLKLTNGEIMTWAKNRSSTNWVTQVPWRQSLQKGVQLKWVLGAPGGFRWLGIRLQLRSWSHGSWVRAPHQVSLSPTSGEHKPSFLSPFLCPLWDSLSLPSLTCALSLKIK